mmetsp:Transcript_16640/g.32248  ORF Transcript_16640/g.32248 Transcript_16640/m.32248 type:complete len:114 (+) Transcript_16640:230-571(+)
MKSVKGGACHLSVLHLEEQTLNLSTRRSLLFLLGLKVLGNIMLKQRTVQDIGAHRTPQQIPSKEEATGPAKDEDQQMKLDGPCNEICELSSERDSDFDPEITVNITQDDLMPT